jgi:glycosyltransferase involved in cell wall biosynthesis
MIKNNLRRITLFHDLRLGGGAELSAKYLLSMKPKSLHVVPSHNMEDARGARAAIVSGVEFFQRRQGIRLLEWLWAGRVPYVVWDHHIGLGNLHPGDWKRVFARAKLILFMSPLHRYWREKNFSEAIKQSRVEVLPVGMDPSVFRPMSSVKRKRIAVCMMTRMGSKKHGVWKYAEGNGKVPLHVYSDVGDPGIHNVFIYPPRPREELPGIYNGATWHVDLPGRPTAGGNASYEAAMCGCKPIVNENVGSASWDWFHKGSDAIREAMADGNRRFWELIGNELGA